MKQLSGVLIGALVLSTVVSTVATPAFALGGCGRNGHRDNWGRCVWGGQNEDWCRRQTGRPAVRMPNGIWRCLR